MAETTTVEVPEDTQPEPETDVSGQDEARKTPDQLFKFSSWLHIGPGAEECEAIDEEAGTNDCANRLHFHAWCRLPNQFQHREIREKALAAKARKVRQARDPETDAHAILEDDLDELAQRGDAAKGELVDELLSKEWWKEMLEAGSDLEEIEDADGTKTWEHIDRDRERLGELAAMPEEKRPKDEWEELNRHVDEHATLLEKAYEERIEPRKRALEDLDINALIDQARGERIRKMSDELFMFEYGKWMQFVGTLTAPGGEPRFQSLKQMEQAAEEVVVGLKDLYSDLERSMGEEARGNS